MRLPFRIYTNEQGQTTIDMTPQEMFRFRQVVEFYVDTGYCMTNADEDSVCQLFQKEPCETCR